MISYENAAISCSYPTPFFLSRVDNFLFYISDNKTFILLYLDFSVLGIIYWPPGKMKNYIFSTSHSQCTHRHTQTCRHTHRTQTLLISSFFSFIRSVLFIFLFLWYFYALCRVSYGYFSCIVQMLALPGFNYYLILLLFICSVFLFTQHPFNLRYSSNNIGLAKKMFRKMLQKNSNELFGQPNAIIPVPSNIFYILQL